jgi:membrane-bound lytic murein transglycosylase A
MSMQRIRQWMEENPDGANELRRTNRSYVFFREVQLPPDAEAVGAQGVSLTPGRSIAVDKALHVYGTPFFIEGELPIETEISKTPFRRLMVAQDTGSAIVGPARADIYFGAGPWAGQVSGRVKQPARFVMLVPKALDPVEAGRSLPLPMPRPSEHIAKLFPQTAPATDVAKPAEPVVAATTPAPVVAPAAPSTAAVTPPTTKETMPAKESDKAASFIGPPAPAALIAPAAVAALGAAKTVPLPEPRPEIKTELKAEAKPPRRERRRVRHQRHRFFWQ